MRVWTIQPLEVWEALQRRRLLYVCPNLPKCRGHIPFAYQWLQEQLVTRLDGYLGHLLWWMYCDKPDLRRHRHALKKRATAVRLELEVAECSLVQFPCWAWHYVFCGDYLAFTRAEYDEWTSRMREAVPDEDVWPLPQPWQSQLEASWERLFAVELPVLDWDQDHAWSRRPRVEGVVEALRLDDVQSVTRFTGTLGPRK